MAERYKGPPATIADLKRNGVRGKCITCSTLNCYKQSDVSFESMGLPDETPFPSIATSRRWVCSKCGGRGVSVMPDWRNQRRR